MRIYWCSECKIGFDSDEAEYRSFEMIGEDTEYIPVCPACGTDAMPAIRCEDCGSIIDTPAATIMDKKICSECRDEYLEQNEYYVVCQRCKRIIDVVLARGEGCHICQFEIEFEMLTNALSDIFGTNMKNKIKLAVKAKGDTK